MKTFKIIMAIAVAIFATTSLIVSLTSPIKSLLDVNVKALTQDEGGTGGTGGTGGIGVSLAVPAVREVVQKKGTYRVPFPGFTATAPGWFGGYFCIFPS